MPTPAERKALLFIGTVALLGGGVRVWKSQHHDTTQHAIAGSDTESEDPQAPASGDRSHRTRNGSKSFKGQKTGSRPYKSKYSNGRSWHSSSRSRPILDSTSPLDLDRATVAQIEALGVLKPGVARMIVEDRDKFGPFGSMEELARVPFLSRYALQALAPRVTFSSIPRPRNAVFPGRPDVPDTAKGARRRRTPNRNVQDRLMPGGAP